MSKTLFQILSEYNRGDTYPFHMPGHKRRLMPDEVDGLYGMDITEIDGFDNLHNAEGILLEAQKFTADLYHSEETHFVINGSTGGILAAIAGLCRDDGRILVARNCHKSVYHAIGLHHLNPVYVYPQINQKFGINEGISAESIEQLWIKYPDIQAVVITSPTYDGVVSDVKSIADVCHSHHIPLIVDEAHGAHFNFSAYFPVSAVKCGADIVIQSVHKTLPAMTQTSIIHLNGHLIDRERVRKMLAVYQTSSPSYILMGSIDACMHLLAEHGEEIYGSYIMRLNKIRTELSKCRHIRLFDRQDLEDKASYDYDRSKLVMSVKNTSLTGMQLHHLLLDKYHIQVEMVSPDYILAMTGPGDDDEGYERLKKAVFEIDGMFSEKIDGMISGKKVNSPSLYRTLPQNVQKLSIYDASWSRKTEILLEASAGRISGDYIYLYPPGIPIVTPGEQITTKVIEIIEEWIQSGMEVSGIIQNTDHHYVKVIP